MTDDSTTVSFTYRIINYMKNVERYPATFLTEFSTIGGILALFQLGVVLRWLHQLMFEKNLQEAVNLKESGDTAAAKASKLKSGDLEAQFYPHHLTYSDIDKMKWRYSLENFEQLIKMSVKNAEENKFLKSKVKQYQTEKRKFSEQLKQMETHIKS